MKKDKKALQAETADKKSKKRGKDKAAGKELHAREEAASFAQEQITAADLVPVETPKPARAASPDTPPATVVMPVSGGLEPIIAPRGHVQLNPVVIPVAFVPYATQNQPLYQTDRVRQGGRQEIGDQPREGGIAAAAAKKDKSAGFAEDEGEKASASKKAALLNRIFAAVMLVGGLVFFLFILLRGFSSKLPADMAVAFGAGDPDLIGGWMDFIDIIKSKGTIYVGNLVSLIAMTAAALIVLVCIILSIVSLANGKGYHVWIAYLLSFVILAVVLLLSVFPKDKAVFGDLAVELNPAAPMGYGYLCQMCIILAALAVLGLIFWPRKAHEEEEDL